MVDVVCRQNENALEVLEHYPRLVSYWRLLRQRTQRTSQEDADKRIPVELRRIALLQEYVRFVDQQDRSPRRRQL